MGTSCIRQLVFLTVAAWPVAADEVIYRYDADVFPFDPAAGWEIFARCDQESGCFQSIENGHLVLRWTMGGDIVNFTHLLTEPSGDFWVEWQFRSNFPFRPTEPGCDGVFVVGNPYDRIWMAGNHVETDEGGDFFSGLALDEFHSYRFERNVGDTYTFAVDGHTFVSKTDNPSNVIGFLQMQGFGSCDFFSERDMWDHVWYGTINEGESIISSSPPEGIVSSFNFPDLDRFTITFDQPGYVYVDDITVEVLSLIGNQQSTIGIPVVLWTKRLVNGEPDTVQIILDQSIPLGMTTRFTFNTGGTPNTVEYTYLPWGACCGNDGSCIESEQEVCDSLGGTFVPGGSCPGLRACCLTDGLCMDLDPSCCENVGGTPSEPDTACENDTDFDGLDGSCGDECPTDPDKIEPGQCGCGEPDSDSDIDTVADCLDICPDEDDRIDEDNDGIPDCRQFFPIPTTTGWGLLIIGLLLATGPKIRSIHARPTAK